MWRALDGGGSRNRELWAHGPWLARDVLARQLLDIPNERSSYTHPTPRRGGSGLSCPSLPP